MSVFVLDTSIDLTGNPCPERLAIDERQLAVSNLADDRQPKPLRRWLWDQVDAFRIEVAVGSHYLQVQVDGQWLDALRRPGDVRGNVTDLVGRLNGRCRKDFRELSNGRWSSARAPCTHGRRQYRLKPELQRPARPGGPVVRRRSAKEDGAALANDGPVVGLGASVSGQRAAAAWYCRWAQ